MRERLVGMAFAVMLAAGCARHARPVTPSVPDARAAIEGIVRGPAGPVPGSLVAAVRTDVTGTAVVDAREAARTRSDGSGHFRFESLPPGTYALTATAPGLAAAYAPAGAPRELLLGADGITIHGALRGADGAPVAGALVRVARESDVEGDVFVTVGDALGRYEVTLPRAKAYRVSAATETHCATGEPARGDGDTALSFTLARCYAADVPAPADVVTALSAGVVPLATVDPTADLSDLAALAPLVKDARVVALGEATHGTREFSLLKHRMIRFLVEEMGFNAFGIEGGFAPAVALDDYVRGGAGDPGRALTELGFWIHDNEEVLDLLRWMRRYNERAAPERKVGFYGFDIQYAAAQSVLPALADISRSDPAFADEMARALAPLTNAFDGNAFDTAMYAHLPRTTHTAVAAALGRARAHPSTTLLARQHLRAAAKIEEAIRDPGVGRFAVRDRAMAENVSSLLEERGPGSKMILWAHNGHVNMDSNAGRGSWPSMGHFLEAKLGAQHVVFGFAFHEGSFRALEDGAYAEVVPPAPPPGSLDATLARLGPPLLALDLARAKASAAQDWLGADLETRESDAAFGGGMKTIAPRRYYDAIFFVRHGSPSRTRVEAPAPTAPLPLRPTLVDGGLEELGGWALSGRGRRAGFRLETSASGLEGGCALLSRAGTLPWAAGDVAQRIDAVPFRGKRVRLTAHVRAEVSGRGNGAQLFLRAVGPTTQGRFGAPQPLGQATMFERPVTSPTWTEQVLELDIPTSAEAIVVGFVLTGVGRAWIDELTLR